VGPSASSSSSPRWPSTESRQPERAADVDAWRRDLEAAADRGQLWRRHRIYRSLEEPDQLVVALEADSYDDATLRAALPESRPFPEARFAGEPRIVDELEGLTSARDKGRAAVARLAVFDSPPDSGPTTAAARDR
jgi:hypothetical protein